MNDDADDSDDCASKKRHSVPLDQNADEQEEEVQQSLASLWQSERRC